MTKEAMDFLKETLERNGPRKRKELLAEAKELGITERTLDRAGRNLGVEKAIYKKDGRIAGSTWELPAR